MFFFLNSADGDKRGLVTVSTMFSEQDSLDCTVHNTASHTGGKQCNVYRTLPTASPTSPTVSNNLELR